MANIFNAAKYPLHSIQTGLYTSGNEYVVWVDNQAEYVGQYHILPNGQAWTGAIPSSESKYLSKKTYEYSDSVKAYNALRLQIESQNVAPIEHHPRPTPQDYTRGYIFTCFVQKRNNPLPTIVEISPQQFNSITYKNGPGINSLLYNSTQIKWMLTTSLAAVLNAQGIRESEKKFPGIEKYLTNPLEFSV